MRKIIIIGLAAILIPFLLSGYDGFAQNSPISPLPTPTHRPAPPWESTTEPTPVPIIGTAVFIENITPTPNIILPTMTPTEIAFTTTEPTPIPIPPLISGGSNFNKPNEQMLKIRGTK